MIIFHWTQARDIQHVVVGDFARHMSSMIRVHNSGGFGTELIDRIVAFEIEVANRTGLLSDAAAEVFWDG